MGLSKYHGLLQKTSESFHTHRSSSPLQSGSKSMSNNGRATAFGLHLTVLTLSVCLSVCLACRTLPTQNSSTNVTVTWMTTYTSPRRTNGDNYGASPLNAALDASPYLRLIRVINLILTTLFIVAVSLTKERTDIPSLCNETSSLCVTAFCRRSLQGLIFGHTSLQNSDSGRHAHDKCTPTF